MKNLRLFLLILIVPFLLNGGGPSVEAQATAVPTITTEQTLQSKQLDKRAQILQAYLSRYNSPLQYQAQDFIDAADTYHLDWKLVAAISGVESTFGKFTPGGYNAWGWGVYGDQAIYFGSWRDGIFTVSQGLRQNYFDKGATDPYSINKIYAASPTWGAHVSYFLADIEKFSTQYQQAHGATQPLPSLTFQVAGLSGQPKVTPIIPFPKDI